jgi:hypothetical protein
VRYLTGSSPNERDRHGFDDIWLTGIVDDVNATRGHQSYIVRMYIVRMHIYETIGRRTIFATGPRHWILGSILGLTSAAAMAQSTEIYKSIDANGNVVYSDHIDASMSRSTTVQLDDPLFPPRELHFCWTNCFTLVLDDGVYRRTDGTDESWTVETFSAKAIALHRHDAAADWNGYSQDVVYAGQVSNDRLVGVTVNGTPVSGISASWGIALNTLPGSNAERDARNTTTPDASSSSAVSSASTPPPLPGEEQPALPEDGYLWTPGYWYWRDQGYFWIPGAWVRPPRAGVLWTPAYWGFAGNVFVFHPGYWGSTVGFYGGVNYGYGYSGRGYSGGHWIGNSFAYNRAVNRMNPAVAHHTYAATIPPAVSQHRSLSQAVTQPATPATVQRIRTPPPSTPPKSNRVTATRGAAPVRQ